MCKQVILGFALMVLACSGCQSARYVSRESETGVIAVSIDQTTWLPQSRLTAEKMMATHFPDGYEVIKEEEVVLGEVITGELPAEPEPEAVIRPVSATRYHRMAGKREYRIYYRRTGG